MCGPKAKNTIEKCETQKCRARERKKQDFRTEMEDEVKEIENKEQIWEMRCWGADRCGALCSNSECIPGPGPGPGRIRSPGRRFPAVRVAYNQHFTPVYRSRQPSGLPACLPASSSGLPPVPVPSCLPSGVLLLTVPAASFPAAFHARYGPVTRGAARHVFIYSRAFPASLFPGSFPIASGPVVFHSSLPASPPS